jgi:MFS family permease
LLDELPPGNDGSAVTRFGPLRGKDFRILFAAECVSVLGDALWPVALAFAVLDLTGSASDLGLVLLANLVPRIVFMLAGGVWADRVSPQRMMVASHFARFVTQGAMGYALVSHHATIGTLVALQVARGMGSAFYRPAATGIVPRLVPREELQPANALLWLAANVSSFIGPALAGVLVATVGPGWAILGDAATFFIAGVLLTLLPREQPIPASERSSFWRDLVEGWEAVRSRTWVWASICYFSCFQLVYLSSFSVLGPVVAKRSLGGAPAWAAIASCGAAGAVIGSLAAYRLRPRRPLLAAFGLAGFGTVPSLVLLAFAAPTVAISAAELLAGIGIGLASTIWETALQQGVPRESLSRVSSYDTLGSIALRPIGLALVGPLMIVAGIRGTLLGAAAIVVASTAAILAVPAIRQVRDSHGPPPPPLDAHVPLAVEISH